MGMSVVTDSLTPCRLRAVRSQVTLKLLDSGLKLLGRYVRLNYRLLKREDEE